MNEAAKQLFITQPSLSNAVRDLENEMGIEIFIRNPKGITLTRDGMEFLSYARQVVEQTQLLEERYKNPIAHRELFSVSSQHYAFVVNAFVSLLKKSDMEKYELFLRETRTWEIIDDVKNFRSEVGVLFLNSYNRDVLSKMLDDNHLVAHHLFTAQPHIFVSKTNPTLFNLLIGLDGYTIATGILNSNLNGDNIVSIPLDIDDPIELVYIQHEKTSLSKMGERFIEYLLEEVRFDS